MNARGHGGKYGCFVFFFISICFQVVWLKTSARASHVPNLITIFPFFLLRIFLILKKGLYQDCRREVVGKGELVVEVQAG